MSSRPASFPSGLDLGYGAGDGFTMIDVRNDNRVTGAAPLPHGRLLILARTVAANDRDFTTFIAVWNATAAATRTSEVTAWSRATCSRPSSSGTSPCRTTGSRSSSGGRTVTPSSRGSAATVRPIARSAATASCSRPRRSSITISGVAIQNDGRIVACGTHRLVGTTRDVIGVERVLA